MQHLGRGFSWAIVLATLTAACGRSAIYIEPSGDDRSAGDAGAALPTRSAGQPTGVLSAGTNVAQLGVTTDIACTCRYDTAAGQSYDAMASTFTATGGTGHTATVIGLLDGQTYSYYVRCRTPAGVTHDDDYVITFAIATAPVPVLYRSVGPASFAALASGSTSNTLTIVGGTALFSVPLPDRIGLGDVIEYDTDADATVDTLAFVNRRNDAQSFGVRQKDGSSLPPSVQASATWAVKRAYTALANVDTGTENIGIAATLRDFDTHTAGVDLMGLGISYAIACYADAADTTGVVLSPGTSSPTHTLRVFTPVGPAEVGVSQRHHGAWTTAAYRLEVTEAAGIISRVAYARFEGLQIHNSVSISDSLTSLGLYSTPTLGTGSDVSVSHNIIRATHTSAVSESIGICGDPGVTGGMTRIWNNVVYDFDQHTSGGAGINLSEGDGIIYNNTVVNCAIGILSGSGAGVEVIRNNLVYGAALDVSFTDFGFVSGGTYGGNLSSDATSPDPAGQSKTVTFVDLPGRDLHLAAGTNFPVDQGMDLTNDPFIAVTDDVDGELRSAPLDIGADER